MHTILTRIVVVGTLFLPAVHSSVVVVAADKTVDYLRHVKPVFIEHCSSCHGGLKQNGGLRLDTAAFIRKGGESGTAIQPGAADKSLLVQVLRGNAGFQMPPEGQGKPPSVEELAAIVQWINNGAIAPVAEVPQADPKAFWSYQPPTRPQVPTVKNAAWVKNPVDAFVAARHESLGLQPQPAAKQHVLLRRLYLDLIGMPPTSEELAKFVADPSDAAYEKTVDDLLGRQQYGERWGRHWMDVWRYSDWYGRRPSNEIRYSQRHIWRWRDWIIESLNDDKGYDQMLLEMLAGDEVALVDTRVLPATGFLGRNWYKFDKNTWLFETVEQTSRGLMAVTMKCCRCHDHKYDPISQTEYYQFRAFFEPHAFRIDAVPGSGKTEVDNGKEAVLADGLARAFDQDLDIPTFRFMRGDDRQPEKDKPLQPAVPVSLGGEVAIQPVQLPAASYMPQLSESYLQTVKASAAESIRKAKEQLQAKTDTLQKLRVELTGLPASAPDSSAKPVKPFLTDEFEKLDSDKWRVASGTWNVDGGKLIESQVTTFATLVSKQDHPRNFVARAKYRKLKPGSYRSVGFSYDYIDGGKTSQDVYTARSDKGTHGSVQAFHRLNGKQFYPQAGIRKADIEVGQWLDLEFKVRESQVRISLNGELKLEYALPLERKPGKFAIWVHSGSAEFERLEITPLKRNAADVQSAIAATEHEITIAQKNIELAGLDRAAKLDQIEAERIRLSPNVANQKPAAIKAHRSQIKLEIATAEIGLLNAKRQVAIAMNKDTQAALKNATRALESAMQKHESADGSYTQFEGKYPSTSTGWRTALARWLTRPENPRTSRVAVNHIWLRHFDQALVPSVDNFGLSGELPSHPQLLDWLATWLSDNNWRTKGLHKLIVMSNTYRLSSQPGRTTDKNATLDPGNRFLWRADSRRMEAEVVRDSVLSVAGELDTTFGGPDLDEKLGQSSKRRSLYFRTTPDNQMQMLSLFDQASPTECYRRRVSVVPQQALALSNGALTIDVSRKLAATLTQQLAKPSSGSEFIAQAFLRILSRPASSDEIADCEEYLLTATELLKSVRGLKAFPASKDTAKVAPSNDPHQRARENLIHVLFNHNDFVTIR